MRKEYYLNEKTKPYSQGTGYELAEQNTKKILPNKNTSQGQVNGLGFVGRETVRRLLKLSGCKRMKGWVVGMQRRHWGDSIQSVTQQPFTEHQPCTTGSEDPAASKTAPNLSLGEFTFVVGEKSTMGK